MMSNTWFNQSPFDVRLEWGLAAAEHLAHEADCAVPGAGCQPPRLPVAG